MSKEREDAVRRVLLAATEPIGPTEIARRIGESWCFDGVYFMSAPITPIVRRIGARRVGNGKYTLTTEGAS